MDQTVCSKCISTRLRFEQAKTTLKVTKLIEHNKPPLYSVCCYPLTIFNDTIPGECSLAVTSNGGKKRWDGPGRSTDDWDRQLISEEWQRHWRRCTYSKWWKFTVISRNNGRWLVLFLLSHKMKRIPGKRPSPVLPLPPSQNLLHFISVLCPSNSTAIWELNLSYDNMAQ